MGLSIEQMQRGAQVAHAFDGKGGKRRIMRKGIIVRIETLDPIDPESQNPYSGVKTIWVQFARGADPEPIPNSELALIKAHDQTEYARLKKDSALEGELDRMDRENRRAEAQSVAEPLVIVEDETGVDPRKPLDEEAVREFEQ